jgi:uncharacterized protein YceK
MCRRISICLMVALTVLVGGCATAINMQDAALRKPYGGFTMPLDDFFGGSEAGDYVLVRFWPIWLLDKPFSLFGDTLTLPYILWLQRDSSSHHEEAESAAGSGASGYDRYGTK